MKKSDLHELARLGVRTKLLALERFLGDLFLEFPEEFLSKTAPVLARSERKARSTWPALAVAAPAPDDETSASDDETGSSEDEPETREAAPRSKQKAAWSPERRAKQAKLMKARSQDLHAARRLKAAANKDETGPPPATNGNGNGHDPTWGGTLWHRVHDFLVTQPKRTATVHEIVAATNAKKSSNVYAGLAHQTDLFQRKGPGIFRLRKVFKHDTNHAAAE